MNYLKFLEDEFIKKAQISNWSAVIQWLESGRSLDSLEELSLNNLNIRLIPLSINCLKALKTLNLHKNKIHKMKNILNNIELPFLTTLDLSFNKITKIQNLDIFPTLTHLFLNHNKIQKIDDYSISTPNFLTLQHLQNLSLRDNKINNIQPILRMKLPNLNSLFLSGNKISNIITIRRLNTPNIQILRINSNLIKQFQSLTEFQSPKIEILSFDCNSIDKNAKIIIKMQSTKSKINRQRNSVMNNWPVISEQV